MRISHFLFILMLVVFVCGCDEWDSSEVGKAADAAIASKDPTKCNSLTVIEDQESCFMRVAMGLNNSDACVYIKNATKITSCYGVVALESRSYDPCSKISDFIAQLSCMSKVTAVKALDVANKIQNDESSPGPQNSGAIITNGEGDELKLTGVSGNIYIMDSSGVVRKAKEGDVLRDGDRIFADEDSGADIQGSQAPYGPPGTPQVILSNHQYYFSSQINPGDAEKESGGIGFFDGIKQIVTGTTMPSIEPPPETIKYPEITILAVEGDVRIASSDGTTVPAQPGMKLGYGQTLVTLDEDSKATINILSTYEGGVQKEKTHVILQNTVIYGEGVEQLEGAMAGATGVR